MTRHKDNTKTWEIFNWSKIIEIVNLLNLKRNESYRLG